MANDYRLIKREKFNDIESDFYTSESDDIFMTADQLGKCLGYSEPIIAINKLISRHDYIKSIEFSVITKLVSTDGKGYDTRLFNEDGIYEITFLSKTAVAQLFRAWVRKVIKEIRKTGLYSLNPYNLLLKNINDNQRLLVVEQSKLSDKLTQHIETYIEDKEMINQTTLSIGYEIEGLKQQVTEEIVERTSYIPVKPLVAKKVNVLNKVRETMFKKWVENAKQQKTKDDYTKRINNIIDNMIIDKWTISDFKLQADRQDRMYAGDDALIHEIGLIAYKYYTGSRIA